MTTSTEESVYQFHPLADAWPLLEGEAFDKLVEDIKTHGLRNPINIDADKKIVDGRNRYRACIDAGVDPKFKMVLLKTSDQVEAFIASQNKHRRHMTADQLSDVMQKMRDEGKSLRQIERETGVSRSTASRKTRSKRVATVSDKTHTTEYKGGLGGGIASPKGKRLTVEEKAAIDSDLKSGKSIRQTAKRNRVSTQTVLREKKTQNKSTQISGEHSPSHLTSEQEQELAQLYREKGSVGRQLKGLGISKDDALRVIKKVFKNDHPAAMIETLKVLYYARPRSGGFKKFSEACDLYDIPFDTAHSVIESCLEYVLPEGGDPVIDVTPLKTTYEGLLRDIANKYPHLVDVTPEAARSVFEMHTELLSMRGKIEKLGKLVDDITLASADANDPVDLEEMSTSHEYELSEVY